jgi:hypothetical protein
MKNSIFLLGDIQVSMENNCLNLWYEEVFDQDQQVDQVYVDEGDDRVLQCYIFQPSRQ